MSYNSSRADSWPIVTHCAPVRIADVVEREPDGMVLGFSAPTRVLSQGAS
ncbi:MAG: hypothetical protein ABMA00_15925 [Gemmatimonas sp.]